MYTAKSGKKFGNIFQGRKHDEVHAEPTDKHEAEETSEFEAGEQEGAKENEEDSQHPVVAEHGPAHTVHIKHDHAAGKHHVHSSHEDGHENMSEHGSAEEAHAEGTKLANVVSKKKEEKPEESLQSAEDDGFSMPSLG